MLSTSQQYRRGNAAVHDQLAAAVNPPLLLRHPRYGQMLVPLHASPPEKPRRLVILGSTGSIGTQTLSVIDAHPEAFEVVALAAQRNEIMLAGQIRRYRPKYAALVDESAARRLRELVAGQPTEILTGASALNELAGLSEAEVVVNAVVGSAGLHASLTTVRSGKILALANKESLVAGGVLFGEICGQTGACIHPIDSEHSALWQALQGNSPAAVRSIILTASGGPFRTWSREELGGVTVEDALAHPTWRMGPKVTIDSATLANKGLEVIEAVILFAVPPEKVRVVVHPQSIVHSMIEFADSSVIAQLSTPDMRLPIAYALSYPERRENQPGKIDWSARSTLQFEPPDRERFPCLGLALDAAIAGGTATALFNAGNEAAVAAFLERSISFLQIPEVISEVMQRIPSGAVTTVEDVLAADTQARACAREVIEKLP